MHSSIEVVAVGHAVVDVLASVEDHVISGLGLDKGTMTLVDEFEADRIHAALPATTTISGGSAANTAVCLASLGTHVRFVGKVGNDPLGRIFAEDIRATGVHFDPKAETHQLSTGRCVVMVTPDAEKTMCTNLGTAANLEVDDIPLADVGGAKVLYLEGYLVGGDMTGPALEHAVDAARADGTLVALSLSDPAWVGIRRAELDSLLDRVDILLANEHEACEMVGTDDIDCAVAVLGRRCHTVAVTRGGLGSLISANECVVAIPAAPVKRVVDTTGAGDSFAAGFLYGLLHDLSPAGSANLGALAAAAIVSHMGARPEMSLSALVADAQSGREFHF